MLVLPVTKDARLPGPLDVVQGDCLAAVVSFCQCHRHLEGCSARRGHRRPAMSTRWASAPSPAVICSTTREAVDDRAQLVVGERLEAEEGRAAEQRRVDLEEGVLGRRPDEGEQAVLDGGQEGVLLALVEAVHLVEEEDGARFSSASRWRAASMVARTSFTPAVTADMDAKCRSVWEAMTLASVVFPVPGGPHKMVDDSRSASISARSGAPGPTRCDCPTMSSKALGRIRAANGACSASRSASACSNRSSPSLAPETLRAGTLLRVPVALNRRQKASDSRPFCLRNGFFPLSPQSPLQIDLPRAFEYLRTQNGGLYPKESVSNQR